MDNIYIPSMESLKDMTDQEKRIHRIHFLENELLNEIAIACSCKNNREKNIATTEIQTGVMWGIRAFMNPEK